MKRHPKRFYLAICTHCGRAWYGTRMNATHEQASERHVTPCNTTCTAPVNVRTKVYHAAKRAKGAR